MRTSAPLLLVLGIALSAGGCGTEAFVGPFEGPLPPLLPAPAGDAVAFIDIVDEAGQPFRPDQAYWYVAPASDGSTEEVAARCENDACTRWSVTGAPMGRVYVGARAEREYPGDPYCQYSRYDAMPVDLEAGAVPTVTLRLEEAVICA